MTRSVPARAGSPKISSRNHLYPTLTLVSRADEDARVAAEALLDELIDAIADAAALEDFEASRKHDDEARRDLRPIFQR